MSDHILVVEDDELSRTALAELLVADGYDVTTAANGVEALERIERTPPALVICDVRMPRASGLQVVQELRRRSTTAHVPVIIVSALSQRERRLAALELGADDFLAKPIDVDELRARVRVQLRHVHHQADLERRSLIDPLTGVLNRRGLTGALRREISRAEREQTALSVLAVDIDDFKGLNDRYGHKLGDTVLRQVARVLVDEVRSIDQVGRTGGDEFVVIAPGADAAAAAALVQRLRQLALPVAVSAQSDIRATISVGDATAEPGDSMDELLDRADRAMYRNKHS